MKCPKFAEGKRCYNRTCTDCFPIDGSFVPTQNAVKQAQPPVHVSQQAKQLQPEQHRQHQNQPQTQSQSQPQTNISVNEHNPNTKQDNQINSQQSDSLPPEYYNYYNGDDNAYAQYNYQQYMNYYNNPYWQNPYGAQAYAGYQYPQYPYMVPQQYYQHDPNQQPQFTPESGAHQYQPQQYNPKERNSNQETNGRVSYPKHKNHNQASNVVNSEPGKQNKPKTYEYLASSNNSLDEDILQAEYEEMIQSEYDSETRDEWFPSSADCDCCKGYIYNCEDKTCISLGCCGCRYVNYEG